MRDHVTEELISAYADGELQGDELKLAEELLAKSPEHQQLLAEYQGLRASIWSLPGLNLPDDFHSRVVRQIDELAATPSKEPVQPARRQSKAVPWRSLFSAAASLAAVLVATVMLHPPAPAPSVYGPSGRVVNLVEMPVFFQKIPKYVMIYDVTVTPAGRKQKSLEKLLEKLGIGLDPTMRLAADQERELMVVRESLQAKGKVETAPYKSDPATPKSTDEDQVEMIYVTSTVGALDQYGTTLNEMSLVGVEVSALHYDLALEPNKFGAMNRLHGTAREHFAYRDDVAPSNVGEAFRFTLRLKLTSVSIPGTAAFPLPSFGPKSDASGASASGESLEAAGLDVHSDGEMTPAEMAGLMARLKQVDGRAVQDADEDDNDQPAEWGKQPGHILLIIRNVGANADAEN